MKKVLNGFIISIIFLLALPILTRATDVDPVDTTDGTEKQDELETVIVKVSDDAIAYQKGDLPYVLEQDNIVIAYEVIHADGTISSMSEGEFNAYYLKYVEITGDKSAHFGGIYDLMDKRKVVVIQNADSEEDAVLTLAIQVSRLSDIPADNIQWKFVEKEGIIHYIYINKNNGKYYEVSEELYNHYLHEDHKWIESNTIIDNGTVGYGTLNMHLNLSGRIQGQSVVVTILHCYDNSKENVMINPPYNETLALETGKHRIDKIALYDHEGYELQYDMVEFGIQEKNTTVFELDVNDPLDVIDIAPVTVEQMAEINESYYLSREEKENEYESETPVIVPSQSIETEDLPKAKKHISRSIIIALIVSFVVIAGSTIYVIYKKRQYEY